MSDVLHIDSKRLTLHGGEMAQTLANANNQWQHRRGVQLRLRAGDLLGLGEAAPLPGYSPDSLQDCIAILDALNTDAIPALNLTQPIAPQVRSAINVLDAALPAARFALESALLDIAGQAIGQPVHGLLGGAGQTVQLSALVTDSESAAAAVARGITTLKLKVGRPGRWLQDLALLRTLRDTLSPTVALRVDANQAWSVTVARERLGRLADLGVELCEEPVRPADLAAMVHSPVAIAVDESLQTMPLGTLERLMEKKIARALVLKPTTLGGSIACLDLARLGEAHGVTSVVTHCFEGPVALAAACETALCLGRPGASGLDRHDALPIWPATDVAQLHAADIAPISGAGLCLAVPRDALSLLGAAREAPDTVALVTENATYRFRDLVEPTIDQLRIQRSAAALNSAENEASVEVNRRGLVSFIARRDVDSLTKIYAALESDTALAPIHERSTDNEIRAQQRALSHVPAGAALIVFTSGSTEVPKAVMLDRAALLASAAASAARLEWHAEDRWLCCLPLAHIGGMSIVLRCLAGRRTVLLSPSAPFSATALHGQIEHHRATLLSLVPTMLSRLLRDNPHWRCPDRVRAILLGGAAASPALLERAAARGFPVRTTYGMSETASQICTTPTSRVPAHPEHGCGTPLAGVELRFAASSRIHVRCPMLMMGYLGEASADIDDDGWFATSDRGYLDAEGNLHVLGRIDEIIISGGENIAPAEVVAALEALPYIDHACVFGVPDAERGQLVGAAVTLLGSSTMLSAKILADLAAARRIASYKLPRRVWVMCELPVGPTGKIDRRAVKGACLEQLSTIHSG